MKKSIVISVLLFCPLLLHAQEITFSSNPIARGVIIERFDSLGMSLDVSMDGSEGVIATQKNTEFRHYTLTVLEADLEQVTSYRLQVHKAWEAGAAFDGNPIDLPVQGKTYILNIGDSATTVLNEDGSPAPDAERTVILTLAGNREEGVLKKLLMGKTMQIGDSIQLREDLLESFRSIVGNKSLDLKAATLKLVDIRDIQNLRCGVFDIRMQFAGAQSAVEMELDLVAEAAISEESLWPISITMNGDMSGVTQQQGMTLLIDGIMKGVKTSTYTRP